MGELHPGEPGFNQIGHMHFILQPGINELSVNV